MTHATHLAPRILVVDDETTNLKILRQILQNDYRLSFAKNGKDALTLAKREVPNMILLDIMMPDMTGFEVCAALKSDPTTRRIPVIYVTALHDDLDEAKGFETGAVDYLTKPVSASITRARIKTHLSLVQTEELKHTYAQLIDRLGRAAEYKDNETGLHVMRMSHSCKIIALSMGFTEAYAEDLRQAAPMHDIGKIGIPDNILLKPGKLDEEELRIMRQHPEIGAAILGESNSPLLELARSLALTHHEKWDGSGYPHGLKGNDIPIEGRIVAIADVFDALTNSRPYKKAWPIEEAITFIQSQNGKHFDPDVVDALMRCVDDIIATTADWREV